jgi:N,N'-diacetyllegionaminate synthase
MIQIIGEAGINHRGNLGDAFRLVDAAKEAGADAVKFQTYNAEQLMPAGKDRDRLAAIELGHADFIAIAEYCADQDIEFMSTPDDVDSLRFLVGECGMKRVKIGSGSLTYRPLMQAAIDTGLPIILSTGMATIEDIDATLRWFPEMRLDEVTLLHCVSLYPCPLHLANLKAMWTLRREFSTHVGYSDHTVGPLACLAATAMGATIIEKHLMLDDGEPPIDAAVSMGAADFKRMVADVRAVEAIKGRGNKRHLSPEELAMRPRVRKTADGMQPSL